MKLVVSGMIVSGVAAVLNIVNMFLAKTNFMFSIHTFGFLISLYCTYYFIQRYNEI